MTRKDFILIASAFQEAYAQSADELVTLGIDSALQEVARALRSTNPSFDRDRFISAATKTRNAPFDES